MNGILGLTFVFALFPILVGYALRLWVSRTGTTPSDPNDRSVLTHSPALYPICLLVGALGGVVFGLAVTPGIEALLTPLSNGLGVRLLRDAVAVALSEEVGKGLLLIALFAVGRIRTPLDGVILGVAAGTGFAAVENWFYFLAAFANEGSDAWWSSIRIRIGLSTWIHGTASAALGAYLGAAWHHGRRDVRWAAPFGGVAAAWAVHGAWNGLLACSHPPGAEWLALLALCVPIASTLGVATVVVRAIRERRAGVSSR